MFGEGFSQEEPYSFFDRHSIANSEVRDANLQRQDFQNPTYQRQYKDWTIEHRAPRITDNDLLYRSELQAVEER